MGAWKRNIERNREAHNKVSDSEYEIRGMLTDRRKRRIIYLIILFTLITLSVGVYFFYIDNNSYTFYIAIILAVLSATGAMLQYLESNTSSAYVSSTYTGLNRKIDLITLDAKIDYLAQNLKNISPADTKVDEEKIYKIVEEGLNLNIQETFAKSLEQKYSDTIIQEIHYKDISDEIIRSKNRILNEIGSLNRRGNLNLVIGSLTTIVAVGILFSSFFYSIKIVKIDEILSHYLPRVSIVLFAEIFAFFFLRLYRTSLIDIKYYQNELTNIEAKGLSLKAAIFMKDKDLYNNIIMDFCKTERNGILKSDESTSTIVLNKNESEKDKNYSDNIKSLAEVIEKVLASKK